MRNLNKDITRFLFFVSSANKPIPCWRGLLYKEEREENAGVCSQNHQTRSAAVPAGAPAGSQVQKNRDLFMALLFQGRKKAHFSHPSSSIGTEFGSFWKEDLVFAVSSPTPSSRVGPSRLGTKKQSP